MGKSQFTRPRRNVIQPAPRPDRTPRRRAAQLEEIAEGLPQRANTLSKLFLSRSSVVVSR